MAATSSGSPDRSPQYWLVSTSADFPDLPAATENALLVLTHHREPTGTSELNKLGDLCSFSVRPHRGNEGEFEVEAFASIRAFDETTHIVFRRCKTAAETTEWYILVKVNADAGVPARVIAVVVADNAPEASAAHALRGILGATPAPLL